VSVRSEAAAIAESIVVRPERRPRQRRRRPALLGGVVSIAALAVLLAGVVALNVAVLQLNLRLDELGRERANLRATNASLSAQLSRAAATPEVEALAQKRLGLVPATPEATTYVELSGR
jgi:Tfp pilus assembly protein PilN